MNTDEIGQSFFGGETLTQAKKYIVVGGTCTALDFLLLFALTEFFGLHYLISSVFSFMSGAALNYYLCTLWIFDTRRFKNRYHEFTLYIIISGIGLLLNTAFIWCFTEFFGFHFMFSKLPATFITLIWNFGARKHFLHTI